MESYDQLAIHELELWKRRMQRKPSIADRFSKSVQNRMNRLIPEKVHNAFTIAIKQMIRGVLTGAEIFNPKPEGEGALQQIEEKVKERIRFYSKTAATEGAITGAGGILLGLADFPLWLSIKMKMLFEITALYGYDVRNFKERIYILHIFQLTFSSQQHRREVFKNMEDWLNYSKHLPEDIHQFDWRNFQQEYRDYIDLSKLLQLVPGIGAITGAVVNLRLTNKLGITAMNAYRMRISRSLSIDGKMLN